jgi:alkyl hydroperoxide reductase subunit D
MIEQLNQQLGASAKDIRLNLANVLTEEGAPGLMINQIYGIALACAYSSKHPLLIDVMRHESSRYLSDEAIAAAHVAATMMAMNNIYYRFTHLVSSDVYKSMPAKLRMTVLANPGVPKVDFELSCLAVSAINGCGMCMDSHRVLLEKEGASREAIQSAVRIAAVIHAAGVGLLGA